MIHRLEQTIDHLTHQLKSLTHANECKDAMINEMRAYIDYINAKQHQHFASSSTPAASATVANATCTLKRHDSAESLSSLMSSFSHRSSSTTTTSALATLHKSGGDDSTKKRSWLRSSFSRAFHRKSGKMSDDETALAQKTSTNTTSTQPNDCSSSGSGSSGGVRATLSDVEENELSISSSSSTSSASSSSSTSASSNPHANFLINHHETTNDTSLARHTSATTCNNNNNSYASLPSSPFRRPISLLNKNQ